MPKPEALITTPVENAQCPTCMAEWAADPSGRPGPFPTSSRCHPRAFAQCDRCGSTDLVDDRSPFEVLAEAQANVLAAPTIDSRMTRRDVVERVADIAAQADPGHCSDCAAWARTAKLAELVQA